MKFVLSMLVILGAASCGADETVTAYGGAHTVWRLVEMGKTPVTSDITIEFHDAGKVVGKAPCNRYMSQNSAPYPWIKLSQLSSTRMACSKLALEGRYLKTLATMNEVEVFQDTLVLRSENGAEMMYKSTPVSD